MTRAALEKVLKLLKPISQAKIEREFDGWHVNLHITEHADICEAIEVIEDALKGEQND